MLFRMAADQMKVSTGQLSVRDGIISVSDATKRVSLGALIDGKKFAVALNPNAKAKDLKNYTIPRHLPLAL